MSPDPEFEYTLERMSGMPARLRELIRSRAFCQKTPDTPREHRSATVPSPHEEEPGALRDQALFGMNLEEICERFLEDSQLAPDALHQRIDHRLEALRRRYRANAGTSPPRRVLVIGAGPVGLRCAIGAALAGHQVTVLEQYGRETRARYLGLFAPEQHFLADLGAPRSMFVELALKGLPKRLVTIADLQDYLKAVALKLGVELRWYAHASFTRSGLASGLVDYVSHAPGSRSAQVAFDVLVDATGVHSRLRHLLVGKRMAGFRTLGRDTLACEGTDPDTYFSPEAPGGARFLVDQMRQLETWEGFVHRAEQLHPEIFDSVDCFVSNIDQSIFGDGRVPDLKSHCPPDWIYERFSRPKDRTLFRFHLEGPFPRSVQGLAEHLRKQGREPVDVIAAFLDVAGAAKHVDREGWHRYRVLENGSPEPARNTASIFQCRLAGLRTRPDQVTIWGQLPGAGDREFFIAGDAAQTPWYRFGVGIMDGFHSAAVFDEVLRLNQGERAHRVLQWERYLRLRAVQVLFSTYLHEQHLRASAVMRELLTTLCSGHEFSGSLGP